MSPSSSPVRRRRPRRPSRGRNRPPRRGAISTVVRSVLVVTAVSSIAIGTYFAFTDDVLSRLIGRQQNTNEDHIVELRAQIDRQYFDQKQVEQQLTALLQRQETLEQALTGELSATGTIKSERIAPPEATLAEKPTPASPINDTAIFFAPPEREARLQSPELPATATTKHHRIHRAAHHRVALRHRVTLRHRVAHAATPAEQSPPRDASVTGQ